jgi:hypothetical protein
VCGLICYTLNPVLQNFPSNVKSLKEALKLCQLSCWGSKPKLEARLSLHLGGGSCSTKPAPAKKVQCSEVDTEELFRRQRYTRAWPCACLIVASLHVLYCLWSYH